MSNLAQPLLTPAEGAATGPPRWKPRMAASLVLVAVFCWAASLRAVRPRHLLLDLHVEPPVPAPAPTDAPLHPANWRRLASTEFAALTLPLGALLWSFLGMAFTCDEYFIPGLQAFCSRYGISQDLAGATLMPMGTCFPELATNVIAVLVTKSQVGLGTVIGCMVVNISLVPGLSALFVLHGILALGVGPFVRDAIFLFLSLGCLSFHIYRGGFSVLAAASLLMLYVAYVTTCASFARIVRVFRKRSDDDEVELLKETSLRIGEVSLDRRILEEGDEPQSAEPPTTDVTPTGLTQSLCSFSPSMSQELSSIMSLKAVSFFTDLSKPKTGWLLMKTRNHCRATGITLGWTRVWVALDPGHRELLLAPQPVHRRYHTHEKKTASTVEGLTIRRTHSAIDVPPRRPAKQNPLPVGGRRLRRVGISPTSSAIADGKLDLKVTGSRGVVRHFRAPSVPARARWLAAFNATIAAAAFDEEERLSVSSEADPEEGGLEFHPVRVPRTFTRFCLWLCAWPLRTALWLTCPELTDESWLITIAIGLLFPVIWLGIFSFALCSAAETLAAMLSFPAEKIGLTVAALGATFPNICASLAVARQGFGPMAVANAIGGIIFTVLVGMGLPYLVAAIGAENKRYAVDASNVSSALGALVVLFAVFFSMALFGRFALRRAHGAVLVVCYGAFWATVFCA